MHTHNKDWEKSSGQASQFNIRSIWAIDRTSAQPRVHLSLLRSNSLKFQPLDVHGTNSSLSRIVSYLKILEVFPFPKSKHSIEKNEKQFKARCKTGNLWMTRPYLTAALIFWYILWFKFWEEKILGKKSTNDKEEALWISNKIIRNM